MKRILSTITIVGLMTGCSGNLSKEGRIRNLESQIAKDSEKLEKLEARVQALESKANE